MEIIKILYIAHDSSLYGANRSLLNLIKGLKDRIDYLVVIPNIGPICDEFDRNGIPYMICKYKLNVSSIPKGMYVMYLLKLLCYKLINVFALIRLLRISDNFKPNLIHSNSSVIDIGLKLARKRDLKHIWHIREFIDLDHNAKVFYGKERFIKKLRTSYVLIAISNCVASHFKITDKASVIYNGVISRSDALSVISTSAKENYFLFVGALKEQKGIEDAIHAFILFAKNNTDYKLLIVGGSATSEYLVRLKNIVKDASLSERIVFLGFKNNILEIMSKAQALLVCSKNEAMGRVTAEAMFSNCPVIGYSNAGTKEIIINKETGLLYTSIEEFSELLNYIVNNKAEVNGICIAAKINAMQKFTEEVYSQQVFDLYEKVHNQ